MILTAVRQEESAILRALPLPREERVGGFLFHIGIVNRIRVILGRSGMGPARAESCCTEALIHYCPSRVIAAGFAGSLNEKVQVGDLVFASTVRAAHDYNTVLNQAAQYGAKIAVR